MFTVALIGADGAGKSTIAKMLKDSFPLPIKYLYMGIDPLASNVILPTTRMIIIGRYRVRKYLHESQTFNSHLPNSNKKRIKFGWIKILRSFIRIILLLTEEYFRLFVSWYYQIRGYIVLYDRHFSFDYDSTIGEPQGNSEPVADRLHRWLLVHFYSKPDLVIFLDAPPEVLYARKGEGTLKYLEARQHAFIKQGEKVPNFVRIDAALPLEEVYSRVYYHMRCFYEQLSGKTLNGELKN